MIVFGVCVGSDERYDTLALASIRRTVGIDAKVIQVRDAESIFEAYNEILDAAARIDGLTALVLLHDDVELQQVDLVDRLRAVLADPTVGVVGVVGARRVTSLAWWEGERVGRVSWNGLGAGPQLDEFGFEDCTVDAVDGMFMALSPWVVSNVRFDQDRYTGFNGYDVDFCFEVRTADRRVVVARIDLHHHDRRAVFPDRLGWLRADIRWRAKWGFIRGSSVPGRLAWLWLRARSTSVLRRMSGLVGASY